MEAESQVTLLEGGTQAGNLEVMPTDDPRMVGTMKVTSQS